MDIATQQQNSTDANQGKADSVGIGHDQKGSQSGARPQCRRKQKTGRTPVRVSRRELPCDEIRRLHRQGLAGTAIAKQLALKASSVNRVLRRMGLGQVRHNREVLPSGRIRCSICRRVKKASEFCSQGTRCRSCIYAEKARQSNRNLPSKIHIRCVWMRCRAKRCDIGFEITGTQLAEMYILQCGRCAYCGKRMVMKLGAGRSPRSASVERIIPQKQGGTYTIKNVVWVHFRCNCRRQALTGAQLKARFPEASKAIERLADARQLDLPFPKDSEINVTSEPQTQPAGVSEIGL